MNSVFNIWRYRVNIIQIVFEIKLLSRRGRSIHRQVLQNKRTFRSDGQWLRLFYYGSRLHTVKYRHTSNWQRTSRDHLSVIHDTKSTSRYQSDIHKKKMLMTSTNCYLALNISEDKLAQFAGLMDNDYVEEKHLTNFYNHLKILKKSKLLWHDMRLGLTD